MRTLLIFSSILLIFNACSYNALREPAPFVHVLGTGEKFRINLPENHIRDEWWTLETEYDKHVVKSLGPAWHGNEKGIDFNFVAGKPGTTALRFTKRKLKEITDTAVFFVKITQN